MKGITIQIGTAEKRVEVGRWNHERFQDHSILSLLHCLKEIESRAGHGPGRGRAGARLSSCTGRAGAASFEIDVIIGGDSSL